MSSVEYDLDSFALFCIIDVVFCRNRMYALMGMWGKLPSLVYFSLVFQCSTLPNHPLPHSHMPLAPAVLISCSRLLLKNEARIFSLLLASSAALATIYTPLSKASSYYTIGLKSRVSLSSPGLHVDEDPRGHLLSVWTSTTKKISYSSPLPQTQYMRKE